MKRIVWGVVIFLIIIFLAFLGLYQFAGLKQYVQATSAIRALPGDERAKAEYKFYNGGDGEGQYGYTGILTYAGKNGLWVWGGMGPRHFRADKDTMYVSWKVCTPDIQARLAARQPFSPNQYVTADIAEWEPREQVGNFVDIRVAAKTNGGKEGNMREARVYDWWMFMAVNMEAVCNK